MTSFDEQEAQAQLRERLGAGARYDAPTAPAQALAWARRGTAYFARKLNELSDEELDAPTLKPSWTRRHVIAHVGYHARSLARSVEASRRGLSEEAMLEPGHQGEDIFTAASLPAHALRYLFKHSEVHLNVEWRDLPADAWRCRVRAMDGQIVQIDQTPWQRAREIWLRAVDLGNGGSFHDIPHDLVDAMIHEALLVFEQPNRRLPFRLVATDREQPAVTASGPQIAGRAADLLGWLTGRGARGLSCSENVLPQIPAVW